MPRLLVLGCCFLTACSLPELASPTTTFESTTTLPSTTSVSPTTTSVPVDGLLVAWTVSALPTGMTEAVSGLDHVLEMTMVQAGITRLVESTDSGGSVVDRAPDGFAYPLDTIGIDPTGYSRLAPGASGEELAALEPGEAILGERSATLRRLDVGSVLHFDDGERLTVTAILPDEAVGAAELVVTQGFPGVDRDRYLLIRHEATAQEMEPAIVAAAGEPTRVVGLGDEPYLRFGSGVVPPIAVKERFGEFALRGDGDSFTVDPVWRENIVFGEVPLLGTVNCHREFIPKLRGALQEVVDRGLGHLIDSTGYRGCWNARWIAGRRGISRHSWGIAVDINFFVEADGADPRLIEVMDRWGFESGHDFLLPDPGHFEWRNDP